MLRDLPLSFRNADDRDVFMNDALGFHQEGEHEYERGGDVDADPFDDVFGSAPTSPSLHDEAGVDRPQQGDLSDIPRLRSTHVTNGYREGIAVSKETHMQEGFDEGYHLGAELGLKAGWCLGALEGLWHALPAKSVSADDGPSVRQAFDREEVRQWLAQAEEDLQTQSLYGKEYFGEDGIWLYNVPGQENGEDGTTFEEIAAAHPIIQSWSERVMSLAATLGLELK